MKDLPKVFPGEVKDVKNTQEVFYSSDRVIKKNNEKLTVVQKINRIFASPYHVYKSRVKISLKNGEVEKVIVGKNNTDLITIDGELIKIIDIEDIERI